MKHFRISIDIDIKAKDREQAELRAQCLYSDVGQRTWITEVLPNGIEERVVIASSRLPKSPPTPLSKRELYHRSQK
jgi:hypothetical protein